MQTNQSRVRRLLRFEPMNCDEEKDASREGKADQMAGQTAEDCVLPISCAARAK